MQPFPHFKRYTLILLVHMKPKRVTAAKDMRY